MKAQRTALLAASLVPVILLTGCTLGDTGDRSRPTTNTTLSFAAPRQVAATTGLTALAGKKIYLDPGHNAVDSPALQKQVPTGRGGTKDCNTTGTAGNDGFPEHTFNWDVAYRLYQILKAEGAQVAFSRPDDASLGPCVDVRAETANKWGADVALSIHADGATPSGHGFHVNLSSPPLNTVQQSVDPRYAQDMRDAMVAAGFTPANYIGSNGLYPRADLTGLNLSTVPTVLVECGNMKNAADEAVLNSAAGQQRIAQALANGLAAFLAG